jgi:ribonuclease Z
MDIYGPPGLEDYLKLALRYSETRLQYPLHIHTVETGLVFTESEYSVYCAPLDHRIPAFGYRIVEHDRPGMFDLSKAQAEGIPAGPLYGRLKGGETVTLPDGRVVDGKAFVGPSYPGRKLAYCTDTTFCRNAVDLARSVDLVIHEATYAEVDRSLALRSKHSTAAMAAQVALEAKAQVLMLTHFSPRYGPEADTSLEDLLAEAEAIFPQTLLAKDRMIYEISRRSCRSE